MGNAAAVSPRLRWLVTLCVLAVLLSVAAHIVADATCQSPDLGGVGQCGDRSNTHPLAVSQLMTCTLLAGSVLPGIINIGRLTVLALTLADVSPIPLDWFASPPIHPPIACS